MDIPRIFNSPAMKQVIGLVDKVAHTNVPVLLTGETGVGKEVIAHLIHEKSTRRDREMVCVNCASLPKDLIESEFFGTVRGSFTGGANRDGLFATASGSTIFLDELSEMSLDGQTKLLRVLQDSVVRRVGSTVGHKVDVRVIAAINRRADDLIRRESLREDLYYRLCTITLNIPPLRSRKLDILPLAKAYLEFHCNLLDRPDVPNFSCDTEKILVGYKWPGNVRELQNEMNRLALIHEGSTVLPADMNLDCGSRDTISELSVTELNDRDLIEAALDRFRWNRRATANYLGIGRGTLYSRIERYGIAAPLKASVTKVRFKPELCSQDLQGSP